MADTQPIDTGQTFPERMGAELVESYQRRGQLAGQLLMATLTETPHVPTVQGEPFAAQLPAGRGVSELSPPEMSAHLWGCIDAAAPGARHIGLERFPTGYRRMLRAVRPRSDAPAPLVDAYRTSFMHEAQALSVPLESPEQGADIIRSAPRWLFALRLSDHDSTNPGAGASQVHDAITADGRQIRITSSPPHGLRRRDRYGLTTSLEQLTDRGGVWPEPEAANRVTQRVLQLRTAIPAPKSVLASLLQD